MVGAHVAHDVVVGSDCVLANGVQLAGHVTVDDWATFGGLSAVGQFAKIGESAFVAGGAMCERDVPPFVIVQGDRARVRALNVVGLRRRGVPEASVRALKRAFRALFASVEARSDALATLDRIDPFVARLADALRRS
jgi:UDP-N-acetylglucosamine acyltransferase